MTARIRSVLIRASPALPFQMRQCSRSASSAIAAFASACRRVVSRQCAGDLLQVLEPHGDMKPVKHRRRGDTGVGEDAPQARAAAGKGGQCRVPGSPSGVGTAADQRLEVGTGFGDDAENLAAASLRSDVAGLHLQVPLAVPAAADERRIQGHNDRRRFCIRPDRSPLTECHANLQGHARPLALNPDLHQPRHPSHASTLSQRTNAKMANWPPHPQSRDGLLNLGRREGREILLHRNGNQVSHGTHRRCPACGRSETGWRTCRHRCFRRCRHLEDGLLHPHPRPSPGPAPSISADICWPSCNALRQIGQAAAERGKRYRSVFAPLLRIAVPPALPRIPMLCHPPPHP